MKTPFTLLATAAALLIATGAVRANVLPSNASISYEDNVGPLGLDWDGRGQLMSLSQFDPLLGTLTAVSLQWRGTLSAYFWAANPVETGRRNAVRYSASGSMSFDLPLSPAAQLTFGPQGGEMALEAGEEREVPILLEAMGGGQYLGALAGFIGIDDFDVRVLAQGDSFMFDESTNVDTDITTTASAWVQVTYDYSAARNAVPEPAALSLLGLAMAAAAIASRRRA